MNFSEAFTLILNGTRVKRPHWDGYWEWDDTKQTVMMHCSPEQSDNGKGTLDIRESQRVKFTIENMLADDWVVATNLNCKLLGGINYMDFGEALKMMRKYDRKIARKGWNGNGQYLTVGHNIFYHDKDSPTGVVAKHDTMGNNAIVFHGTSGVQVGWLASQADLLADDWYLVD